MEYHVFNKRPSRAAVANASQYQHAAEQRDALALATFPAKGELWEHLYSGRRIVIKSNHIPIIHGTPESRPAIDEFGVMVADVIDGKADFTIFFTLRQLLNYKKVGKAGKL
jgi:hypothetical protein